MIYIKKSFWRIIGSNLPDLSSAAITAIPSRILRRRHLHFYSVLPRVTWASQKQGLCTRKRCLWTWDTWTGANTSERLNPFNSNFIISRDMSLFLNFFYRIIKQIYRKLPAIVIKNTMSTKKLSLYMLGEYHFKSGVKGISYNFQS